MKALTRSTDVLLTEGQKLVSPDGFQHPNSAWNLWSAEEWQRWFGAGVQVLPVEPAVTPFGHVPDGPPSYAVERGKVVTKQAFKPRPLEEIKADLRAQAQAEEIQAALKLLAQTATERRCAEINAATSIAELAALKGG